MTKFQLPRAFTVPDTIEGVMGLLTARGWERAAIVYAYTKPGDGQGKRTSSEKPDEVPAEFPCSMAAFARLGISGLRDKDTITFYREQWKAGIANGWAEMVGPGDTFDLPDMPFPAVGHDREPTEAEEMAAEEVGVSATQVARAAANSKAIKAAIKANPELAEQVAEDLPAKAIGRAIKKDPAKARVARETLVEVDHGRDLADAVEGHRDYYGDNATADQAALLMQMRAVRANLQSILGWTINLRGAGSSGLRTGVEEEVAHWRSYITAIEEAAAGRSMDAEIDRLLSEESA